MIKRILIVLFVLLLLAQFAQPDRSTPPVDPGKDMLVMSNAPGSIRASVVGACYDCHSDATRYPVWACITPINFWVQHHIEEGREHLNFSRWDRFTGAEAAAECGESMLEGSMPPAYYARMHDHAQLTSSQRQELITWFDTTMGEGEKHEGEGEQDERD